MATLCEASLDATQWRHEVIDVTLADPSGAAVEFIGDTLVSSPGQGCSIEFTSRTSLAARAILDIPLFVSTPAQAWVWVNGHLAHQAELQSSTTPLPLLQRLTVDITSWTEASAESSVRLQVAYHRNQGTTTILRDAERPEHGAKVVPRPSWAARGQCWVFWSLAWASILACAILIIAHTKLLSETIRFYATVTVACGWMASVLGIPDLARIPVRGVLRRAYAATRPRRGVALAMLALFFTVTGTAAAAVVYCLTVRYWYTRTITRSFSAPASADPASIRRAFVLLPWRKEAQILLERHAYKLRTEASMPALRNYVGAFVKDSAVKTAITRASSSSDLPLPLVMRDDPRWLGDPVVWYAALLPEAEEEADTTLITEAVRLLARDTLEPAFLLRMSFEMSLRQNDTAAVGRLRKEVIRYLNADMDAVLPEMFEYEVVSDVIALSYLRACDMATASRWFHRELDARQQTSSSQGYEILHRPPHKLLLYHLFASYLGLDESEAQVADRVLDYTNGSPACPPFRETFRQEFLENPSYAAFRTREGWLKHTIVDSNLQSLLEASLQSGWRY